MTTARFDHEQITDMINIRIKFFTRVPHAPCFLLLPVSLQTINPRGFGFQIELNKCINLL